MVLAPERWDAPSVEASSWRFWSSRGLERSGNGFGPANGPLVHQFLGTIFRFDAPLVLAQRTAAGDAWARILSLEGRRTITTVEGAPFPVEGGTDPDRSLRPVGLEWDSPGGGEPSTAAIASVVARLAEQGVLERAAAPMLTCLRCRIAPTPETTLYMEELGDAYLVRFPLTDDPRSARLLVWTDAVWKLLGAPALLVAPELPYVVVKRAHRGNVEHVVIARAALSRLGEWFPKDRHEIVEELTGQHLVGRAYVHPLGTSYPPLATLAPPAGTVLADPLVTADGSGIAPLLPAHSPVDSAVATRLSIPVWPVLGGDGRALATLRHNYADLPISDVEAFALRELIDDGSLFATLRRHRGVPHCSMCGSELLWLPGSTWVIRSAKLSPELRTRIGELLPAVGPTLLASPGPWPAAELAPAEGTEAPTLRECGQCERLAPEGSAERCVCGGALTSVRRVLLPGFRDGLVAALRQRPYAPGETVRVVLHDRRAGPALLHLLIGLYGAGANPADVRVLCLPSLPTVGSSPPIGGSGSIDAWRLAVLAVESAPKAPDTVAGGAARSARLIARLWALCARVIAVSESVGFVPDPQPISRPTDLLPEDRALLAKFERFRGDFRRALEADRLSKAVALGLAFFDRVLHPAAELFLERRLSVKAEAPARTSALRTLWHILPLHLELCGALMPFTADALHRGFRGDRESLFQHVSAPVQQGLIDSGAEAQFDRWIGLAETFRHLRAQHQLGDRDLRTGAVLQLDTEELAAEYRRDGEVLSRLARVPTLAIASPASPFDRYRLQVEASTEEIQRAYGMKAPRIAHVLSSMDSTRVREGLRAGTLSVALEGYSVPITASMVTVATTLPDGWIVRPTPGGILFIELPRAEGRAPTPRFPRLSNDALRIAERLAVHPVLRRPEAAAQRVRLVVGGELGRELRENRFGLSQALGLPKLEVDESPLPSENRIERGRTPRGVRWELQVGRNARHRPRSFGPRFRFARPRLQHPHAAEKTGPSGPDLLSADEREKAATLRSTRARLDTVLGSPFLGSAKLEYAWEAGVRTYEDFSHASFSTLEPIPGFGPALAELIVLRFGGEVPSRPPRIRLIPAEATLAAVGGAETVETGTPADTGLELESAPIDSMDGDPGAGAAENPEPPEVADAGEGAEPGPSHEPPASESVAAHPQVAATAEAEAPALEPVEDSGPGAGDASSSESPAPSGSTDPEAKAAEGGGGFLAGAAAGAAVGAGAAVALSRPDGEAAPPESPPPPVGGLEFTIGGTDAAWARFLDAAAAGLRGLCISREFPDRVKARLGPRNVAVLWLSNAGRESSIRPTDLAGLQATIERSVMEEGASVVFLSGLDYLLLLHAPESIVPFLRSLDELGKSRGVRLWAPVEPDLTDSTKLAAVRANFP